MNIIKKDFLGRVYIQIFRRKFYWPLVWHSTFMQAVSYGEMQAEQNYKRMALGLVQQRWMKSTLEDVLKTLERCK